MGDPLGAKLDAPDSNLKVPGFKFEFLVEPGPAECLQVTEALLTPQILAHNAENKEAKETV